MGTRRVVWALLAGGLAACGDGASGGGAADGLADVGGEVGGGDAGAADVGAGDAGAADVGGGDAGGPDALADAVDGAGDVAGDGGGTDGGADGGADAGPDVDAGPVTPAGTVAKITSPNQLIGGLAAYGRVDGGWLVQNDAARFIVQDSGVSVGLNLYGGNLVDADLVRPPGEPGNDRFREMFPLVGFRVSNAETVTVLDDGTGGVEAALRVTGTDEKSKIIDILDSLVGATYGFTIHTDTIVRPGIPGALIRTTVENPTAKDWSDVVAGDLLSYGKLLELFYAESGFGEPDAGLVTRLVAVGDGVSYGYARPSGSFLLPLVDASGTGAMYESGLDLPAGGSDSFERWFVVGTGDVASVMETLDQLRGEPAWALEGTLREKGTGAPVAGGFVTAVVDGHAANQARAAEDGTWRMTLQPGVAYGLVASGPGRPDAAEVPAPLVAEPGEVATLDVEVGAPGFLAVDAGGPARVVLQAVSVAAQDPRLGARPRTNGPRSLLTADGTDTWAVEPGTWRVVVTRGPEHEVHVEEVVVDEAATVTVTAALEHSVDTAGWVAGDFHLHTIGSMDADMQLAEKVMQLAAEGVEVAASTDHDNVTDYGPALAETGLAGAMHFMAGNEISVNGVGHFNAYPLPLDDVYPLIGTKFWQGFTIQELIDRVEEVSPGAIFQLNHPRSTAMGYMAWLGFDPVAGEATVKGRVLAEGFDAMEVNSEIGTPDQFLPESDAKMASLGAGGSEKVPSLRDWFGLLAAGRDVAAMGNSDSHFWKDKAGYPRTWLRVGVDDPAQVTDAMVVDAIRAQRAVVGAGVFVTVRVDGEERMGHAEPVAAGEGGAALEVRVQAPTWVGVDRLEVYEDGRPLRLTLAEDGALVPGAEGELWWPVPPADGVTRFEGVVRVSPDQARRYVFLARGAGASNGVFGGASYGYTNPVVVTP